MPIDQALRESAEESKLNPVQVAARIGRSEQSARWYMSGKSVPSGDTMLCLMREVPGFAERLGFTVLGHAA